ncbi:MAG: L-lactate dehydrogenase, partial [Pseudomonadota bacterium]
RAVLSVSIVADEIAGARGIALSLPRIVGDEGVVADLMPPLDAEETAGLARSAGVLAEYARDLSV